LLHHAHFGTKDGFRTFAAIGTNGSNAQIATFANSALCRDQSRFHAAMPRAQADVRGTRTIQAWLIGSYAARTTAHPRQRP